MPTFLINSANLTSSLEKRGSLCIMRPVIRGLNVSKRIYLSKMKHIFNLSKLKKVANLKSTTFFLQINSLY